MKKLFLIALLPILVAACAKQDDNNPSFRTPTCSDTTDDGIFENYSNSEAAQFLKYYKNIPATPDTTVLKFLQISSHTLYNKAILYDPYIYYKVNRPTLCFVYLPLQTQQQEYYSWVQTVSDTSQVDTIAVYNARLLNLQRGCYRLYYVFSDTDTGTVFNKGHYDIEIK